MINPAFLLDPIAGEKAEQLYANSFQSVCRCISLLGIEDRCADVGVVDIGMAYARLDCDIRSLKRVIAIECDSEV